jgi:hypothetical protein
MKYRFNTANSVRRWTSAAIDCYKRACRCEGCYFEYCLKGKCRMKHSVIESVRVLGKPEDVVIKQVVED